MATLTPTLIPLSPGRSALPLGANDATLQIGRADDLNDVVIKESRVSRRHCKVLRDGYFVYIRDYSTNGTVVNGTLLNNNLRVLGEGEVFEVGSLKWRLDYKRSNQVHALELETTVSNFDTVGAS